MCLGDTHGDLDTGHIVYNQSRRNTSLLVIVLMLTAVLSSHSFAQSKAITAAEFMSARNSANSAMWKSYPRVLTYTYKSEEPRDVRLHEVHESAKRSSKRTEIATLNRSDLTEEVSYDGETFLRINNGPWQSPGPSIMSAGTGRTAETLTYTVEEITESGKTLKLYTETVTIRGQNPHISWFKVDAAGRMQEYKDIESFTRHATYEYPEKVTPIVKPMIEPEQKSVTPRQTKSKPRETKKKSSQIPLI